MEWRLPKNKKSCCDRYRPVPIHGTGRYFLVGPIRIVPTSLLLEKKLEGYGISSIIGRPVRYVIQNLD